MSTIARSPGHRSSSSPKREVKTVPHDLLRQSAPSENVISFGGGGLHEDARCSRRAHTIVVCRTAIDTAAGRSGRRGGVSRPYHAECPDARPARLRVDEVRSEIDPYGPTPTPPPSWRLGHEWPESRSRTCGRPPTGGGCDRRSPSSLRPRRPARPADLERAAGPLCGLPAVGRDRPWRPALRRLHQHGPRTRMAGWSWVVVRRAALDGAGPGGASAAVRRAHRRRARGAVQPSPLRVVRRPWAALARRARHRQHVPGDRRHLLPGRPVQRPARRPEGEPAAAGPGLARVHDRSRSGPGGRGT